MKQAQQKRFRNMKHSAFGTILRELVTPVSTLLEK
jgi:hypothetical protein